MKRLKSYGVLGAILVTATATAFAADSATNAIPGLLGYAVGTRLTVEGTRVEKSKGYALNVLKVNGKDLDQPVRIRLKNIASPFEVSTNTLCCFKGEERTFVVTDDPKTGRPVTQAATGRHYTFVITEVVSPEGLKLRESK